MNKRTAIIFYILSIYVIIQFIWWGYHLIELTQELVQKDELISKRVTMILGEGTVFLVILFLGIWQIRRSIYKELRLSERQNNFLLSVTHELKTPLAANKLYIQTINKRELSKDQQNDLLRKAIDENRRLENMIDNILNASRLENNALSIEKEKFNLNTLIKEIITRFNTFNNKKIIEAILTENIDCFGDKFMIETILNNLIENALKYAGVEHKITVYATVKKKMICFGVKDLGPGIRKDLRSRIFEKFYRIGSEEIRSQKGSGLGLFIVSELVKMHKGELLCLENIPNGSNFEINIPK